MAWLGFAEIDKSDPENVKFAADLVKEFGSLPDNKNQTTVEKWLQAKYDALCKKP